MKWNKQGIVYSAPFDGSWRDNSALTPTAFQLNKDVIRVYCSFRDKQGVGRIGYVDVDSSDPTVVLDISKTPVLDIGAKGRFDDNGVILGDVIRYKDRIYMYYVGFQLVKKAKFLAYSGLALSTDEGETFSRISQAPILDRTDEGLVIRAIHSVIYEGGCFKVWYAVGNGWEIIEGVEYPQYDINYIESPDGVNFEKAGVKCLQNDKDNLEYRIGRPRVYRSGNEYIMNFTYGTTDGRYFPGQASSIDGSVWKRKDDDLGVELSESGWDSTHLSYPSIITVKNNTYMFYNGNEMGLNGFGVAELMTDE